MTDPIDPRGSTRSGQPPAQAPTVRQAGELSNAQVERLKRFRAIANRRYYHYARNFELFLNVDGKQ